ncbi:phage protein NinX family protein [Pseudomonas prosekii]|uniref:phage protein NinX family protein n=1 Tax=Pseudomonas prosekii TaxID=1148509 RepID=UPI003F75006E
MSDMIDVKVSKLIGPALDWAVAFVEGVPVKLAGSISDDGDLRVIEDIDAPIDYRFNPSTDWRLSGPFIASRRICHSWLSQDLWDAYPARPNEPTIYMRGPTPLIAICRAIVANKFCDVVSIPKELVQ